MSFISVSKVAEKWGVSKRSVRNSYAKMRVEGAFLTGKTWKIPDTAQKPKKLNSKLKPPTTLLEILKEQKKSIMSGGIYHKIQIDMTYNSNHIEGGKLTYDQSRYIYETNSIGITGSTLKVDDIVETANHFRCIDIVIDTAKEKINKSLIKELHLVLKNGTKYNNYFTMLDLE